MWARFLIFFGLFVSQVNVLAVEHDIDLSSRVRSAGHEIEGNDGDSASVLLRLSYSAQWNDALSTFVEVDYVETFLEDQFSDGVRLNGQPFIFDAPGEDLNQLFVDLTIEDFGVRLGRQRLNFDDQRLVGGIGIWQNEQTFDALHLSKNIFSASSLTYTYVDNVNRVLGEDADEDIDPDDALFAVFNGVRPAALLGDHDLESHFVRFQFNELDYSNIVAYAYFDDNKDRPTVANNTLGLSYEFNYKVGQLRYRARLDGAFQERTEAAKNSRIPYALLELAVGKNALEIMGRVEMMGEDDGAQFVTPLASVHEFNGWADKFLFIPSAGLVAQSLQVSWRQSPWRMSFRYHVFNEYDGNSRYGDEFDFDITYKLLDKHSLHLRYGVFRNSDEFENTFTNSNKYFVTYSYNFN